MKKLALIAIIITIATIAIFASMNNTQETTINTIPVQHEVVELAPQQITTTVIMVNGNAINSNVVISEVVAGAKVEKNNHYFATNNESTNTAIAVNR